MGIESKLYSAGILFTDPLRSGHTWAHAGRRDQAGQRHPGYRGTGPRCIWLSLVPDVRAQHRPKIWFHPPQNIRQGGEGLCQIQGQVVMITKGGMQVWWRWVGTVASAVSLAGVSHRLRPSNEWTGVEKGVVGTGWGSCGSSKQATQTERQSKRPPQSQVQSRADRMAIAPGEVQNGHKCD